MQLNGDNVDNSKSLSKVKQSQNHLKLIQLTCPQDVIISVEGVSKKFCRSLRRMLLYTGIDFTQTLLPRFMRPKDDLSKPLYLRKGEFLAIDNISFQLKRGESLGLLGINGSGKTTLLRLIYGIYPFDRGRVEIRGRVGALLAAGVGFHNQMTGRENIYVNGAILGFNKAEIDAKFQDIIDFADIAEFIDAPAGTYSSGMRVRLGFAIVAHAEVDILIADEVLAVGDGAFRQKCFERIDLMKSKGTSIVFVSHVVDQVLKICDKALYMKKGKMISYGDVADVVKLYKEENPGV
jgi:lipopolysaccharide transport system ATP-binding protein